MAALNISHELLQVRNGEAPPAMATESSEQAKGDSKASKEDNEIPAPAGLSGLNAKLDEALHQLRQLEIG